ncbi:hypothetical protein ACFQYP_55345 [Nonomuraea antimicrobica]
MGGTGFAACGLLAAQLCQSAALARGAAVGVLAVGLVPGVVVPGEWIGLLPAGWSRLARAYGAERWWAPLVPLAFTVVLALVVYALAARRDLGAGLLPDRAGGTGPVRGRLAGTSALVWRLYGGRRSPGRSPWARSPSASAGCRPRSSCPRSPGRRCWRSSRTSCAWPWAA